jgi:phage shock protein A
MELTPENDVEYLRSEKVKEKNKANKEEQNEINLTEKSKRELLILEKINVGIMQIANEIHKLYEYENNECKTLENKLGEYKQQISIFNKNKEKSAKNIESLERQILKNKAAKENIMNLHDSEKTQKENYLMNMKKEYELIEQGINKKINLINTQYMEIKGINLSVYFKNFNIILK